MTKVQYQNLYSENYTMPEGQIIDHSFSAVYTNSTINIKHHFIDVNASSSIKNSPNLKFTWRRLYGDMINLSVNNGHQYFCSPLDWDALIEVQIEKNGILIDKSVYGPILLEEKIKEKSLVNTFKRYKAWISVNNSNPKYAEIIVLKASPVLFRISVGNQTFQFERDFMQRRGWDVLSCLPDSGILIIQTKNFKKRQQFAEFLQKIKLKLAQNVENNSNFQKSENKFGNEEELSIVFIERIQRDEFLVQLINETCDIRKTKSMKHLINQKSQENIVLYPEHTFQRKPSINNIRSKRLQIDDSLIQILDNQNGLGNRTMQDLFEIIYTPTQSVSHTPQKHSNHSMHRSSKNLINKSKSSQNDILRQINSLNGLTKILTDTKQKNTRRQRKCSVSIHFKNPEEYQLNSIHYEYQYDPQLEILLKNPQRIKQLLYRARQLKQQNRYLKKQIEQIRIRQQAIKHDSTNNYSNNDIKYLKSMIQQINTQMTTRIVNLEEKVTKNTQRPVTFQSRSRKQSGKQIPYKKCMNTNGVSLSRNNVPNFIRNGNKNRQHDIYQNHSGDVNINNFININGHRSHHDAHLSPPPMLQVQKGQSQVQIDIESAISIKGSEKQFLLSQQSNQIVNFKTHKIHEKKYMNKQHNANIRMFKFNSSPNKRLNYRQK